VSGSLQLGFSDYEQFYAKKKTRRQIFLEEMEATIPWDDFHALIRPVVCVQWLAAAARDCVLIAHC
jgi:hypothetical protein